METTIVYRGYIGIIPVAEFLGSKMSTLNIIGYPDRK